jgi:hypothetical protein
VSAAEIIEQLPKLSPAERQAILDKLRELAQVDDDRWEQIINEPMPRPKLKAFIEQATAEGSEPLDLNRMWFRGLLGAFGRRTREWMPRKKGRRDAPLLCSCRIPDTIRFNSKNFAVTQIIGRWE